MYSVNILFFKFEKFKNIARIMYTQNTSHCKANSAKHKKGRMQTDGCITRIWVIATVASFILFYLFLRNNCFMISQQKDVAYRWSKLWSLRCCLINYSTQTFFCTTVQYHAVLRSNFSGDVCKGMQGSLSSRTKIISIRMK